MADDSCMLAPDDRDLTVTILRWPVLERENRKLRRTLVPLERRRCRVIGYEFYFDGEDVPDGERIPPNSAPRCVVVAFALPDTAAFSLATGRCVATPDWVLDDESLAAVRAERKRRWRRKRKPKSPDAEATSEDATADDSDLGAFLAGTPPPANEVANA